MNTISYFLLATAIFPLIAAGAGTGGVFSAAGSAGAAGVAGAGASVLVSRIASTRLVFAVTGFTIPAFTSSGTIFIVAKLNAILRGGSAAVPAVAERALYSLTIGARGLGISQSITILNWRYALGIS